MRQRLCSTGMAVVALCCLCGGSTAVAGQGAQTDNGYATPRTPWGDPDLQGMWDTRTYTPFERPADFGTREFMTEDEVAERERLGLRRVISDDDDDAVAQELVQQDVTRYARSDAPDDGRPGYRIAGAEYNAFWSSDPTAPPLSLRTSQIVDPPDGRLPPLTARTLDTWGAREELRSGRSQADDWEDRGLSERCITRNGLPGEMLGSSQQPLKELVQAPGVVSIVMPYGYVRVIAVSADREDMLAPLGSTIRQWNGDSRGYWDGDTLVVETANFKETVVNAVPAHGGPFGGSAHVHYYPGDGQTLRLTERFRRIADNTLEYQYTVEDPEVFVEVFSTVNYFTLDPWAVEGNQDRLFEYACHEHNYGMVNAIRAARVDRDWALGEAAREASIRRRELGEKREQLREWVDTRDAAR